MSDRPRRPFTHTGCGGVIDGTGMCDSCGAIPEPSELTIHPRPGKPAVAKADPVSKALQSAHPFFAPIREPAPQA
jgi:hypothetical protein